MVFSIHTIGVLSLAPSGTTGYKVVNMEGTLGRHKNIDRGKNGGLLGPL